MSLTALEALSLAWSPDSTPGSDQRSGALTIRGISSLPIQVEWGDGQIETIEPPDDEPEDA